MICSSIDIGTNSVLLLIAKKENGKLQVLDEKIEVPRLGRGVDGDRTLHTESINRVINVLLSYRSYLEEHYPQIAESTIVTATSAVRDSSNRKEFIEKVKNETGWDIRLLSGETEAETTFSGALSVIDSSFDRGKVAVLDIGGGSTEIAVGQNHRLQQSISIDMGSVRFSERFLKSNPPQSDEILSAEREIDILLKESGIDFKDVDFVVGVAGTVTSMAAIELEMDSYEPDKLANYPLKRKAVARYISDFSKMKSSEIERKYPLFLKNRGDVILAGLLILHKFLEFTEQSEVIVSTGGIRHGVLLRDQ